MMIPEQTITVYVRDLSDVPLSILRPAIEQCRAESHFFPSVAAIKEKASAMATANSAAAHPDSCKCHGTGMYVPEGVDADGYKFGARRCDGLPARPEGFIGPPDPDDDIDENW
jgi:hypothetical protein